MARSVSFSMRSTPPRPLRAGVASPPQCKGRGKLPERHICYGPTAFRNAFPISTISPGKKDWLSLLKKNRNLETNSFILKDAVGHPKGCFKSVESTGTYTVLVSNWVDWELAKSPQLSFVTWG